MSDTLSYCTTCGSPLGAAATFCTACGKRSNADTHTAVATPQPMLVQAAPPTNHKCVWSLMFGVLSMTPLGLGVFAAVPAILLGVKARRETAISGEQGRGMATAGMAMGIIVLSFVALALLYFWAAYREMSAG